MLVFRFSIMIFIFTNFICHVCHKLTVMYVTKLYAVICFVIEKNYQPYYSPSIGSSFNASFSICIFRENSSYIYISKKGRFSDSGTSRYSK